MEDLKPSEQEAIFNHLCDSILEKSYRTGLQLEVIWSAFKHKEEVPMASLLECLQVGADEWDIDIQLYEI